MPVPDLNFQVEKAEPVTFAVSPLLIFKLRVREAGTVPTSIHAITLWCQIRIEPTRRSYGAPEAERLLDLFGTRDRWGQTLKAMLWTHTSVVVPPFTGTTVVDLPVPCTFDFNVAATKYFNALEDGEVPLVLLFSGTIFYDTEDHGLQVAQISWEKEASFRLPVPVWRKMMDHYYPNSAWLCLRKDMFDRLALYKSRQGIPTWEQALERLLPATDEQGMP